MPDDLRDQPDGIGEGDDYRIPSPTAAAKRVHAYVTETGDGLYDEQGGQPLYGRDLAALACAVLHGYRADRPSRCLHVPSDATLATEAAHAATADSYEAGRRDALSVSAEQVEAGAREAFLTDDLGGHIRGPWTWETIPEVGRENYRAMVRAVIRGALGIVVSDRPEVTT